MECIEAIGENRGSEGHDGLTSMLREAGASTLHSCPDDRLRCGLGDASPDRVVPLDRVGVIHPPGLVLIGDVVDRGGQFLLASLRWHRRKPAAHRAQHLLGAIIVFLERFAPSCCEHARLRRVGALDRIRGFLHVLGDVEVTAVRTRGAMWPG